MKNRQNVQGESYEVLRSSRERNGELCAERTHPQANARKESMSKRFSEIFINIQLFLKSKCCALTLT